MLFLKPAIVGLLNSVGLELRNRARDIPALQALPRQPSAGHLLELIGTQGVGKTTLSNALYPDLKAGWFFRSDLRRSGPLTAAAGALEALHRQILFDKLAEIKARQPDPWKSLTLARQMSTVIYESLLLATHEFPRGFVQDEGLFKNFPAQVCALDPQLARPLWDMRILVHVRARDPELALERHQKRRSARMERGVYQHEDDAGALLEHIRGDDATYAQIIATAQALGRPVTTVYVEDGLARNRAQILDFERTLIF